jgi:hypothetical protein
VGKELVVVKVKLVVNDPPCALIAIGRFVTVVPETSISNPKQSVIVPDVVMLTPLKVVAFPPFVIRKPNISVTTTYGACTGHAKRPAYSGRTRLLKKPVANPRMASPPMMKGMYPGNNIVFFSNMNILIHYLCYKSFFYNKNVCLRNYVSLVFFVYFIRARVHTRFSSLLLGVQTQTCGEAVLVCLPSFVSIGFFKTFYGSLVVLPQIEEGISDRIIVIPLSPFLFMITPPSKKTYYKNKSQI